MSAQCPEIASVRQSMSISTFNYDSLESEIAQEAREAAALIRKRTREAFIDVGRDLITWKDRLDRGQFVVWVVSECGLSIRTAQRAMQAAEVLEKNDKLSYLPPDGLITLAVRSAPKDIVNEIIQRIDAGETPTAVEIKFLINEAKKARKAAAKDVNDAEPSPAEEKAETEETEPAEQAAAAEEAIELLVKYLGDQFGDFVTLFNRAGPRFGEGLRKRYEQALSACMELELLGRWGAQETTPAFGELAVPTPAVAEAPAETKSLCRAAELEADPALSAPSATVVQTAEAQSSVELPRDAITLRSESVAEDAVSWIAEAAAQPEPPTETTGSQRNTTDAPAPETAVSEPFALNEPKPIRELIQIYEQLKRNPQWYFRYWVFNGFVIHEDENHMITDRLQTIRAKYLAASPEHQAAMREHLPCCDVVNEASEAAAEAASSPDGEPATALSVAAHTESAETANA
jgi:hypothetical protein